MSDSNITLPAVDEYVTMPKFSNTIVPASAVQAGMPKMD